MISVSLRRLAAATRMVLQAEAAGRRIGVGPALERAGVNKWFLKKTEEQLTPHAAARQPNLPLASGSRSRSEGR